MIYNATQTGNNIIQTSYTIDSDPLFFLGILKVPCYSGKIGQSKAVILNYVGCDDYYQINFEGVQAIYEDLTSGMIYFNNIGTWNVDLYYQDNDTNLDPDNANYLETFQLQITYGES